MLTQGVEVFLGKRQCAAAVDVDQRVIDQAGIAGNRSFWVTTTSIPYGGLRRASIRLGIAWGAMFQSPACLSLAIRRAARLGAVGLEVVHLARP